MDWFAATLIFVIVWWLVLFMVLPFGVRPADEVQPGTEPSAPAKPRLVFKVLVTTGLALAITAGIMWLLDSGLISLRPAR